MVLSSLDFFFYFDSFSRFPLTIGGNLKCPYNPTFLVPISYDSGLYSFTMTTYSGHTTTTNNVVIFIFLALFFSPFFLPQ